MAHAILDIELLEFIAIGRVEHAPIGEGAIYIQKDEFNVFLGSFRLFISLLALVNLFCLALYLQE